MNPLASFHLLPMKHSFFSLRGPRWLLSPKYWIFRLIFSKPMMFLLLCTIQSKCLFLFSPTFYQISSIALFSATNHCKWHDSSFQLWCSVEMTYIFFVQKPSSWMKCTGRWPVGARAAIGLKCLLSVLANKLTAPHNSAILRKNQLLCKY